MFTTSDLLYAARHARRLGLRMARRFHIEQYFAIRAARCNRTA